ncbi:MAG TPA: Rrf2 family transcriptional regulator [Amycolatopsis sp.]|nr:Rrf2 family transcriptional regulator [Amycolatopsis sp.]
MQLTKFTDLALRVILRLSRANGMTRTGLAAGVGASEDDLGPVTDRLRELGLLVVRHDERVGLAPDSRGVSIGWIVRELEGTGEVVDCEGSTVCPLAHGCRLRTVLRRAQQAFFGALDPVTVDDIARGSTTSLEILPIGAR